ncbi:uncharacterized protein MELLADRAFT_110008 [Melampsora larici-populina 98AG31]|uniref:Uncharacterized protein n=1 Tax=Melampsora larici-populina (strain 98AG31 / pathotype 3-4-7) TaxID=747676 RepID=F4RYC2_MELLP|nr:uncharacterized protein MELLADRAFT_110008 [Melampsora larici-populina 98AG31]EGG02651.1 hypothetical protein MELLADRAFT_110008 [Melampsora larici-populina 98AG31]
MHDSSAINPSDKPSSPTSPPPLDEESIAPLNSAETHMLSKLGSMPISEESWKEALATHQQKFLLLNTQDNHTLPRTAPATEPQDSYNSVVFQDLASLGPLYSAKPLKPKPAFLRLLPHPDSTSTRKNPTLPPLSINQAASLGSVDREHHPQSDSTIGFNMSCAPFNPLIPSLDSDGVLDGGGLDGIYVPTLSSPLLIDLGNELISLYSPVISRGMRLPPPLPPEKTDSFDFAPGSTM